MALAICVSKRAPSGALLLLSSPLTRCLSVGLLAVMGLVLSAEVLASAPTCAAVGETRAATVAYVYDGDTVRLKDGTRIRLAGIDAPEVPHPNRPGEPFGEASSQALSAMLARTHNRIRVEVARDAHDHYGRELAYLYLPDGQSIQSALLDKGLAMAIYMPPNLTHADCFAAHERQARSSHVGIWSSSEYDPGVSTTHIPRDVVGAAIIRGKVLSVGRSRHFIWLNLEGRVALQISRKHIDRFAGIDFDQWKGRVLRARGWLVKDHNRYQDWRMAIQSPRSIEVLGN